MHKKSFLLLTLSIFAFGLLIPPNTDARLAGWGMRNSFRSNYYVRQQQVRQRQMAAQRQRQAQQRAAAQRRAADVRRRQQAARQRQIQRQRVVRERQRQMQVKMRNRQQAVRLQRQRSIERQRSTRVQKQQQRAQTSNRPTNRAEQTRLVQRQMSLRQQRLLKQRQDRLRKLRNDRKQQRQRAKERQNTITLASLSRHATSLVKSTIRDKSTTRVSNTQFKKMRQQQAKRPRVTSQLAEARRTTQSKLRRLRVTNQRLRAKNQSAKLTKASQTKQNERSKQAHRNFPRCKGGVCKTGNCSFHGDTYVLTETGPKTISKILPYVDRVWSRNEFNGAEAWNTVTGRFSRDYPVTLTISTRNIATSETNTIVSNEVHPFFVLNDLRRKASLQTQSSRYGKWRQASDLQVGDRLSSTVNQEVVIEHIDRKHERINAFNIAVAQFPTYFVSGRPGDFGIWVHNSKNCNHGNGRRVYEKADYHGKKDSGRKNKAPKNGERALENSFRLGRSTDRRIGYDAKNKEIVILDKHAPGKYHGHVVKWKEMKQPQKNVLIRAGIVNPKGKIKKE